MAILIFYVQKESFFTCVRRNLLAKYPLKTNFYNVPAKLARNIAFLTSHARSVFIIEN